MDVSPGRTGRDRQAPGGTQPLRPQTGERLSAKQANRLEPPDFADRIKLFVLNPPREELYEKINKRTEAHFENGLVEEVKKLLESSVNPARNALGAHAYRRVCEYLRGTRDLVSAIEQSKQDIRNYAKRQFTWFRREEDAIWLSGFGDEEPGWTDILRAITASNSVK